MARVMGKLTLGRFRIDGNFLAQSAGLFAASFDKLTVAAINRP